MSKDTTSGNKHPLPTKPEGVPEGMWKVYLIYYLNTPDECPKTFDEWLGI